MVGGGLEADRRGTVEAGGASPEQDMTEGGAHQLATVLGPVEEVEAKVEEGTRAHKKQGALVLCVICADHGGHSLSQRMSIRVQGT